VREVLAVPQGIAQALLLFRSRSYQNKIKLTALLWWASCIKAIRLSTRKKFCPQCTIFPAKIHDQLRVFELVGSSYLELELSEPRVWMNDIQLGLGQWQGVYQGIDRVWLRWYDAGGNWILTPEERERQGVERERRRVERLVEQLR
jgi:hypothetical protein